MEHIETNDELSCLPVCPLRQAESVPIIIELEASISSTYTDQLFARSQKRNLVDSAMECSKYLPSSPTPGVQAFDEKPGCAATLPRPRATLRTLSALAAPSGSVRTASHTVGGRFRRCACGALRWFAALAKGSTTAPCISRLQRLHVIQGCVEGMSLSGGESDEDHSDDDTSTCRRVFRASDRRP